MPQARSHSQPKGFIIEATGPEVHYLVKAKPFEDVIDFMDTLLPALYRGYNVSIELVPLANNKTKVDVVVKK